MSGHSKWATTKRAKFATDAKRSAVFTKLANMITVAVRTGGGGDPEMNFKLRLAVDKARSASMPKENIERSIKRGLGEGSGANIEEVIYEGLLPLKSAGQGAAFIIEALTDNRNRTVSDLRATLTKHGGRLVSAGSMIYLFDQVAQLYVLKSSNQLAKDEIELIIIDSGAGDYSDDEEGYFIYSKVEELKNIKTTLEQAGLSVESAEIVYKPKTALELSAEDEEKVGRFMDALDDLGDVKEVYTNA
jgi:YebC/PmpR family DNA-binding regulatory protein